MKKILTLMVLLIPILIPTAQAITHNCTAIGQQIVVPDCICSADCPTCPEPWNVTIGTIEIPNVTCSYDMAGVAESVQGCVDSLTACRDNLQDCDSQMTAQGFQNQSLLRCQSELLSAESKVKTTEDQWKQYVAIAALGSAGLAWYYMSEKQKPSGSDFRRERE